MSRARQLLALLLLAIFVYITGGLFPAFWRNLRFQRAMETLTQTPGVLTQPAEQIRAQVLARAAEMGLPVEASNVQVEVMPRSVRIAIRYVQPVRLPGYTVKLHFAPSAGR